MIIEYEALRNINRLLKEQGHLILSIYNRFSLMNIQKELRQAGFSITHVFLTEDNNPLRHDQYEIIDEIDYSRYSKRVLLLMKMLITPKYHIIARKY